MDHKQKKAIPRKTGLQRKYEELVKMGLPVHSNEPQKTIGESISQTFQTITHYGINDPRTLSWNT